MKKGDRHTLDSIVMISEHRKGKESNEMLKCGWFTIRLDDVNLKLLSESNRGSQG